MNKSLEAIVKATEVNVLAIYQVLRSFSGVLLLMCVASDCT